MDNEYAKIVTSEYREKPNDHYSAIRRNEKRSGFSVRRKRGSAELELFDYAFSLGKYSDENKKYEGRELPGWRMGKE